MKSRILSSFLLLPLLVACTTSGSTSANSPAVDQTEIRISREVLQGYDAYLRRQLPLAFAVGADGRGYGYTYCDGMRCVGTAQASTDAISYCNENYGGSGDCAIFALGRGQPRKYTLVD